MAEKKKDVKKAGPKKKPLKKTGAGKSPSPSKSKKTPPKIAGKNTKKTSSKKIPLKKTGAVKSPSPSKSKKTPPKITGKNTKKTSSKKIPLKKVRAGKSPSPTKAVKTPLKTIEKHVLPIVGVGASAGGLEALEGFLSEMPSNSNMAFVFIQHLAPKYKSVMPELLKKYTTMKINVIKDGIKIKPNCIYLNPPNMNVAIINNTLRLIEQRETYGVRLSIDYFFRSLAEDQGGRAICVILSGTGTDGTMGLKAIKGEGGMTMVQEDSQAKYDGMPRSAIETGLVDYVLPVEKMGQELMKYVKHPYIAGHERAGTPEKIYGNHLQKIFLMIRSNTGHDFSHYKLNTIRRRIERRMAVHRIAKLEDYVAYLQQSTDEVDTLYKDMLITVTNFFRDPDAFGVLNEEVIKNLVKNKRDGSQFRVWVPGCATGEEAYSIGILIAEAMEKYGKHFDVQIFATDIDAEAIAFGRFATYPEGIATDVSHERLKKYFLKQDGTYKIKKKIREMLVFSLQNLIKDPPFSNLDLISCRNVLIYMDSVLQKKILPLFHYTLTQGGFLFLGTSESIGQFNNIFTSVNTKWKVFRHKGVVMERQIGRPKVPYPFTVGDTTEPKKIKHLAAADFRSLAEKIVLDNYAPASVLVNSSYDILFFQGETDFYLTPPAGEPTFNILKLARDDLRYKLSIALHKAVNQRITVVSEKILIRHNNQDRTIDLVVKPITETDPGQNLMMVIFEDKTPYGKTNNKANNKAKKPQKAHIKADPKVVALEHELQSTKEYLQTTIEELETSNEELKSTNEELQSTNEEIQSTNEELETSKEELQSTNEELSTVNAELQSKMHEMSGANDDLNNLLDSTDIGTIFLDTDFCIKFFTPTMSGLFNLINSDIGRPISDITSNIAYTGFRQDAEDVLKSLVQKETEVHTSDGKWFSMRMTPYRTVDNVIDGVVITFVDISVVKQFSESLQESEEKYRAIFQEARDGIVLLDYETGKIVDCNPSFERQVGRGLAELKKKKIWDLRPPKKVATTKKLFDEIKDKGKGGPQVLELQKPGGQLFSVEFKSKVITIQGIKHIQGITYHPAAEK